MEYEVRWCEACELGRLAAEFSFDDVSRFFDIPYYTHGVRSENAKPTLLSERALRRLAWQADYGKQFTPDDLGLPGDRVLCDIGCGDGANLKIFRDAGFRVAGIEPDPKARARAARYGSVFDGTAEHLPDEIVARQFDVVLMMHVLDACIDINKAIANACSIIRPGGTIVIECPNCASLGFKTFAAYWQWVDIPRHQHFFTEKSMRFLLVSHRLSIAQISYVGYTRQFLSSCRGKETGGARFLWLTRTAFRVAAQKYDSFRVVATRI
jgi:2-polyprenyl-3-methyl-5-hydroxy-6-metoxy-1,4-benzoquinol methylase